MIFFTKRLHDVVNEIMDKRISRDEKLVIKRDSYSSSLRYKLILFFGDSRVCEIWRDEVIWPVRWSEKLLPLVRKTAREYLEKMIIRKEQELAKINAEERKKRKEEVNSFNQEVLDKLF